MGSCISALTTMGRFLPFLCLLGLALSGPVVDQETDKMVREMGDVIEAGLIEPSHGDARALFISLTLTSTSTSLATATTTSTVTASCYNWVNSATTTTTPTTAAASGRRKRMVHMNRRDEFMDTIDDYMQDARVTLDGKEVDISMILPTSTHARFDLEDEAPTMYTNLDAPGLQSGRMEWSEVAVDSTAGLGSNCGRSGHSHEKRPRIIALQNEIITKNLTSTSTVLVTASTTQTFQVTLSTSPSFTNTAFTACTATTG